MFDLQRLRKIGELWSFDTPPTTKNLGVLLCGAADEIDRFRAIVDKLPKTADGVAVVPGVALYHPEGGSPRIASAIDPRGCHLYYSTPEAAEAAGEEARS